MRVATELSKTYMPRCTIHVQYSGVKDAKAAAGHLLLSDMRSINPMTYDRGSFGYRSQLGHEIYGVFPQKALQGLRYRRVLLASQSLNADGRRT